MFHDACRVVWGLERSRVYSVAALSSFSLLLLFAQTLPHALHADQLWIEPGWAFLGKLFPNFSTVINIIPVNFRLNSLNSRGL